MQYFTVSVKLIDILAWRQICHNSEDNEPRMCSKGHNDISRHGGATTVDLSCCMMWLWQVVHSLLVRRVTCGALIPHCTRTEDYTGSKHSPSEFRHTTCPPLSRSPSEFQHPICAPLAFAHSEFGHPICAPVAFAIRILAITCAPITSLKQWDENNWSSMCTRDAPIP